MASVFPVVNTYRYCVVTLTSVTDYASFVNKKVSFRHIPRFGGILEELMVWAELDNNFNSN